MKKTVTLLLSILLTACGTTSNWAPATLDSAASKVAGYTYIPLDPLPVNAAGAESCERFAGSDLLALKDGFQFKDPTGAKFSITAQPLLDALPDNAVRISIKEITNGVTASLGASSIGYAGRRYLVVLDFINVDVVNIPFIVSTENNVLTVQRVPSEIQISDSARARFLSSSDKNAKSSDSNVVIPVYVGVGLRLTADIDVKSGNLNLASLGAIAAAVEAKSASGSLVVQTLGLTGKQVMASLPLPSELNQTTVQNAIQSLGAIKAVIYDESSAHSYVRVTGLYLPLSSGSPELVNKIVSEIARYPVLWKRNCLIKAVS